MTPWSTSPAASRHPLRKGDLGQALGLVVAGCISQTISVPLVFLGVNAYISPCG